MPTTTWGANKDATTADNGISLGAGTMNYLPIGNYAGFDYRAFVQFAYSFSGIVSITSAILHMKTTGQVKVAFGSDPDLEIRRANATWFEGSASSPSSTNAIERSNEPGVTGSTVTWDVTTAENTWDTVDITTIIQEAFSAGVFYGLRLVSASGATSDVTEFYAREYGSNDAYIEVTYTTNRLPNAPTLNTPVVLATGQSLTPTFVFTHNDPDGDPPVTYDLQVSTDGSFASVTHWNLVNGSSGMVGDTITRVYGGTALANNTSYWWRARTNDGSGDGTWQVSQVFTTAKLPTATLTTPSADGVFGKLTFTTGWTAPRLNVGWNFACGDGGTQTHYQIVITEATTHGGVYGAWHDTGTVASSSKTYVDPTTVINGRYYKVKVRVTCSHGQVSSYTSEFRAKGVWAEALHRFDCTSPPVSWSVGTITTTLNSGTVSLEYGSNSITATPGTFYSSVSSLTLARYFFYRARLFPQPNATSITWPSLDKLILTYSVNALVADHWVRSAPTTQTLDTASSVGPGSKAMKLTGDGTTQAISQLVEVQPNTDYVVSAMAKGLGNAGGLIAISTGPVSGAQVSSGTEFPFTADREWTHIKSTVWNSESATSVYVVCRMAGAGGTFMWFDDVKLEASRVATAYSPASSQDAAVAEGGGVQVDASMTGVFRLKGSSGGATAQVSLGANGLVFGQTGDVELYRGNEGELYVSHTGGGGDAMVRTVSGSGANVYSAFLVMKNGDSAARAVFGRSGDVDRTGMFLGSGAGVRDTGIYRSGTATLQTDSAFDFTTGSRARLTGVITPTALAANTNDWNPTGLATANVIKVTTDAALRQLSGIVAGASGDLMLLANANAAQAITLMHDVTSTAANRFLCPGSVNFTLNHRATVWLWYDGASSRWRLLAQ